MRLPPADKALRRQLIELFDLQALGFVPMNGGLPLAQFFEHSDLAIGLDQHLAAAIGLGLNLSDLRSQRSPLSRQRQLESMHLQQSIDIGGAGRFELASLLGCRSLLPLNRLVLGTQHFLGTQRLGQIGTALITLGDAQAKERFEAKMERQHCLGLARCWFGGCWRLGWRYRFSGGLALLGQL